MSFKDLEKAALKGASAGAGTYIASKLLANDASAVPVSLGGYSMNLATTLAMAFALSSIANEYLIQDLVAPNVPKGFQGWTSVGGAAAKTATVGGTSAALFYASNPQDLSTSGAVQVAAVSAAGSALGEYAYEKAIQPLADKYVF